MGQPGHVDVPGVRRRRFGAGGLGTTRRLQIGWTAVVRRSSYLILAFALVWVAAGHAQEGNGWIAGLISDQTGAPAPARGIAHDVHPFP